MHLQPRLGNIFLACIPHVVRLANAVSNASNSPASLGTSSRVASCAGALLSALLDDSFELHLKSVMELRFSPTLLVSWDSERWIKFGWSFVVRLFFCQTLRLALGLGLRLGTLFQPVKVASHACNAGSQCHNLLVIVVRFTRRNAQYWSEQRHNTHTSFALWSSWHDFTQQVVGCCWRVSFCVFSHTHCIPNGM